MISEYEKEPEYKTPNRCPKCGLGAEVHQRQLKGHYYVCCPSHVCKYVVVTKDYDTWNEAVDAWNNGEYTITPIREK